MDTIHLMDQNRNGEEEEAVAGLVSIQFFSPAKQSETPSMSLFISFFLFLELLLIIYLLIYLFIYSFIYYFIFYLL